EHVVPPAQHVDGKLLLVGEDEGLAHVVDVLRPDEDVGRSATAERRVEGQGLLEPNLAAYLDEHAGLLLPSGRRTRPRLLPAERAPGRRVRRCLRPPA